MTAEQREQVREVLFNFVAAQNGSHAYMSHQALDAIAAIMAPKISEEQLEHEASLHLERELRERAGETVMDSM